jgi:hypothetical protein
MRQQHRTLLGGVLLLAVINGCGTSMTPGVGTGIGDRPGAMPPGLPPGRDPGAAPGLTPATPSRDDRTGTERICRTQPVPIGWIVTGYVSAGGEQCPRLDPDEPFPVAIIERFDQKPVGSTMEVCADQRIPRDWRLDTSVPASGACHGARVLREQPTSIVIRRFR